jgi:MTH538 TIR-like domain (DUF1863)
VYTFAKKKICISFDWHNDRDYRNLLSAWLANPKNPIDFHDLTPGAIDTNDVGRLKAVLTTQIRAATHTLVLLGTYANTTHKDSAKIGTRNWIWWEIEQRKAEKNRLIAVKLKSDNPTPDPLYNSGAKWAMSFTQDAIIKAVNEA